MDDRARFDGRLVSRLRQIKGWTQAALAQAMGTVGIGWIRKVEGGNPVRLEWSANGRAVHAAAGLAKALDADLDTLIVDVLDGDNLRQLMERHHWNSEQLADMAHVDLQVLTRAESGGYVHRSEARALAEVFDVPVFELFFRPRVNQPSLDTEESAKYLQAAMVGLCMIGRTRAVRLERTADESEILEEALGRIHFTLWKMTRGVANQGYAPGTTAPYAVAIETAIGSEFAYRNVVPLDSDVVAQARMIVAGQEEGMVSFFSTCDHLTAEYLNSWTDRNDRDFQWKAPDINLRSLCSTGYAGLAMAINAARYHASEDYAEASTEEAGARLDFLTAFVSRHHRNFSEPSGLEHSESIRLLMLLVVGSQMAAYGGKRLTFLDTVEIEESAQDLLSWVLCNPSVSST
ncbi:MAG: hypothetical protein OXF11_14565 [Deltaproteobacteria bacterium]|nr:hypothetical protein [Deltaproteobacteria bacterium]